MKIIADEKIPFIKDYFGAHGELILKPGRTLQRSDVVDADILIVRSITHVNETLLHDTAVKFVGTVAAGADHLDKHWLDEANIRWATAAGSNARAVVEYTLCVIAALQKMQLLTENKLRAAVIGVGRIGSQVAEQLKTLGFEVVLCDPIRAAQEKDFISTPLEDIKDCDFITLHTPLTRKGAHPTYHLIGKDFLQRQKKNSILLNASRGSVIDSSALKLYGETLYWCLDVWENEPLINFQVLDLVTIASPHIAGHTLQAKQRGIDMIYQSACEQKIISPSKKFSVEFPERHIDFENKKVDWRDVVLTVYDPRDTTMLMKQKLIENAEKFFDVLRNDFNHRHEFAFVSIANAVLTPRDQKYLESLGLHNSS
jgi:erythronate-4-phosphate dehydrogenase